MNIHLKCPNCHSILHENYNYQNVECHECSFKQDYKTIKESFINGEILMIEDNTIKQIRESKTMASNLLEKDKYNEDDTKKNKKISGSVKSVKDIEKEKGESKEELEENSLDFYSLFDGSNLSESFKQKAKILFQASVNEQVELQKSKLQEKFDNEILSYKEELAEELIEHKDELSEQLDIHCNYVAETYMENNKIAIEEGLRVQRARNLIEGITELLQENSIDICELENDIVEEQEQLISNLKESLNQEIQEKENLIESLNDEGKLNVIEEVSWDLSHSQKEKLLCLSEGIDFSDDFKHELELIKNKFVVNKSSSFQDEKLTEESKRLTEEFASSEVDYSKDTKPELTEFKFSL